MSARTVLSVSGPDREKFLQGLVSNDVTRARPEKGGIVYTALLTPQGKFIVDFFVIGQRDVLLIDVAESHATLLQQRLSMYRLRADITILPTTLAVSRGTGPAPAGALADPRDPEMGWRLYSETSQPDNTDWDALRVANLVPETGIELTPETYILEAGFERLHGVDFRKGCYVGQEVTARMKHKTELRKGLMQVHVSGPAVPVGTAILAPDGREAGTLYTRAGSLALAHLRFDRAAGPLSAGDAVVEVVSQTE